MGTSTSNRGQNGNTPLVPSWLDDDNEQQQLPAPMVDPKRFSAPRSNFTRYVNGGNSGSLRRAVSSYVRHSLGGSRNATARLGAARSSTARLVSLFNGFINRGVEETSQEYNLGELIGKNAADFFLMMVDFVCPDGGSTDEGIARSSYVEAISSFPDWSSKPIESLTPSEFLAFTELFMANVIVDRLLNDIGNKLFALPDDVSRVDNLQSQLEDYIKGAISDAITQLSIDISSINSSHAQSIVDSIYHDAYDLLSGLEV